MKSWLVVLDEAGDLKKAKCDWCSKSHENMYRVDTNNVIDDLVCEDCLRDTPYEDQDDLIVDLNSKMENIKDILK